MPSTACKPRRDTVSAPKRFNTPGTPGGGLEKLLGRNLGSLTSTTDESHCGSPIEFVRRSNIMATDMKNDLPVEEFHQFFRKASDEQKLKDEQRRSDIERIQAQSRDLKSILRHSGDSQRSSSGSEKVVIFEGAEVVFYDAEPREPSPWLNFAFSPSPDDLVTKDDCGATPKAGSENTCSTDYGSIPGLYTERFFPDSNSKRPSTLSDTSASGSWFRSCWSSRRESFSDDE